MASRSLTAAGEAVDRARRRLLRGGRRLHRPSEREANIRPQALSAAQRPSHTVPADLVIANATAPGRRGTFAVAVSGGRISYVGAEVEPFVGERTRRLDAAGGSVLPGFTDSHVHLLIGAEQLAGVNVSDVRDVGTFRKRVRRFAESTGLPVLYVYGVRYDEAQLLPPEKSREMLDDLAPDRPLFVYSFDLHAGWCNTAALKTAALFHTMPPHPEILRELDLTENLRLDEEGYPSGEIREPEAYALVDSALQARHPLTGEQKRDFLRSICSELAGCGLTGVHNMSLALPEEDIETLLLLLELEQEGQLPLRVATSCSVVADEHMIADVHAAADVRDALDSAADGRSSAVELHDALIDAIRDADRRRALSPSTDDVHEAIAGRWGVLDDHRLLLRRRRHSVHIAPHLDRLDARRARAGQVETAFGGMVTCRTLKLFVDGVVETDTAWLDDIPPGEGIPAFSQEELDEVVLQADRLGLQVAAHCIGDAAVRSMLDAVANARRRNRGIDQRRGHRIRHRIEHIELCGEREVQRFAELEVIPSMQPLHADPPRTLWHKKVPRSAWARGFPWRSFVRAGAAPAFGSDWPIVSANALDGVRRALTRTPWAPGQPAQSLSLDEALAGYTTRAAVAEYAEAVRGRLEAGLSADLVVLSGDISQTPPDQLRDLHPRWTLCRGEITHAAE